MIVNRTVAFLGALLLLSGNCSATIYMGASKTLGTGTVRTYVEVIGGTTVEVGIEATASAMTDLASDTHLHLELPGSGLYDVSPIDHVAVGFATAGHPGGPLDTYWAVPHFDVHFMTITEAASSLIVVPDPTNVLDPVYNTPAATDIPTNYILGPNSGVSEEGSHWVNPAEFADFPKPFDFNFLYGFYNGSMTFEEPMVSQEYLVALQTGTESEFNEPFEVSQTNHGFGNRYFTRHDGSVFQIGIMIPEPSTALLMCLGMIALAAGRWSR